MQVYVVEANGLGESIRVNGQIRWRGLTEVLNEIGTNLVAVSTNEVEPFHKIFYTLNEDGHNYEYKIVVSKCDGSNVIADGEKYDMLVFEVLSLLDDEGWKIRFVNTVQGYYKKLHFVLVREKVKQVINF